MLNTEAKQKLAQFQSMAQENISKPTSDRFLILCREVNQQALNLETILRPLGLTEIIPDTPHPSTGSWYSDYEANGFGGLTGGASFPFITAWSRAFVHLEKTLGKHERIWFVEDDVAGHPFAFQALINKSRNYPADLQANYIRTPISDPDWWWWNNIPHPSWLEQNISSFNPLCNMSPSLAESILVFRQQHSQFTFHETLFASLAQQQGKKIIDWQTIPELKFLFGTFDWRPEISSYKLAISHPVKHAGLHTRICNPLYSLT